MFEAYNFEGEKEQQVMIIVDGGEKEVDAFRKLAETKSPSESNCIKYCHRGLRRRGDEDRRVYQDFCHIPNS